MSRSSNDRLLHTSTATETKILQSAAHQEVLVGVNTLVKSLLNPGANSPGECGHSAWILRIKKGCGEAAKEGEKREGDEEVHTQTMVSRVSKKVTKRLYSPEAVI